MRTHTLTLTSFRNLFLVLAVGAAALGVFTLATLLARAQSVPTVETTVHNEASATTTSAAIGTIVHARVALASTTATSTPEGTVDFTLYQNTSCTGNSTTQAGVALTNGVAISGTTTVPATGLSYLVHYNGQQDVYDPTDGSCAALTATAANVGITTTLSTTSIMAGEFAYDTAFLQNATTNATGTVAYKVYSDNTCTTLALDAGSKTVVNSVVPDSENWQFITPGTYYWQAAYSGDQFNTATTSVCVDEVLTVTATSTPPEPEPETGTIMVDKVTIPSGDTTSFHFTTTGSGYASFNLTDQASPNSQTLATGTYAVSEDTLNGWQLDSAQCSVDGLATTTYTPGTDLALGAGQTVLCIFRNSTTTPPQEEGTGSISGMKYNDLDGDGIKDADEPGLSGWTINLYGTLKEHGRWWHGFKWGFWRDREVVETTTTDANGNYSFDNLEDGTYIVREVKQDGWRQTSTPQGPVTVENGSDVTGVDFGNTSTPPQDDDHGNGNGHDKDKKEKADKQPKQEKGGGIGNDDDDDDDHGGNSDDDDDNGNGNGHGRALGAQISGKVHGILSGVFGNFFGEDN